MHLTFETDIIPSLLQHFLLTAVFGFIIGLELHSYRRRGDLDLGFGTTRTITLISVMGFVLYSIDPDLRVFLAGLITLSLFLGLYYYRRSGENQFSLLMPILGVLTYFLAPVVILFPGWFAIVFVVSILMMLSGVSGIRRFSDAFNRREMVTFIKFLIMAGVILPLLPNSQIADAISVTYYQVWMSLLLVSTLSYVSYLIQTYVFKEQGLLVTGILGGLYSSTAATIVIGRRAAQLKPTPQITQATILATAMMYLRLLALVFFMGHTQAAQQLLLPFSAFVGATLLATWFASYLPHPIDIADEKLPLTHPLEFRTALVFSVLFVVFAGITSFVIGEYGSGGLKVLSFLVGLTDIDPFILSLLGGDFDISQTQLISAVVIASGSNNLMKAGYVFMLGRNRFALAAALWLILLFAASIAYVFWLL